MSRWPTERFARRRDLLLGAGCTWDLADGTVHADFAAWCAAHPRAACRLHVSSELVTELPVDAALPLDDDAALLDWARVQWRGQAGSDDQAPPDFAAWEGGDVRGVSVLHGTRVADLQAQAAAAGVRLVAVQPWWSAVLVRARRRHAALRKGRALLVVVEGARIAAVDLSWGQVAGVQTTYLDAADGRALCDWVQGRGAQATVAAGYGVAAGTVAPIEALPGLHASGPGITWREALR